MKGRINIENRKYGIDLLRIISMMMIVTLHVLRNGGIINSVEELSPQFNAAWILDCVCMASVNCYALISGYVGVNRTPKYHKLAVLWIQVVFYSLVIMAIFSAAHIAKVTGADYFNAVTPVLTYRYWYFTAYFALFLFMPFLNAMINVLDKRALKALAVLTVAVFSVMSTLSVGDVFHLNKGYSFLWIAAMYLLGGVTKKLYKEGSANNLLMICCFAAGTAAAFAFYYHGVKTGFHAELKYAPDFQLLTYYNSPAILLSGYSLFILAINSNIKSRAAIKVIKTLSPLTFGVYIIHTNPLIFKNLLADCFIDYALLSPLILILKTLLTVIVIYLLCSGIDFIRLCLFRLIRLPQGLSNLENKITAKRSKSEVELSEKV